jgi:hypothetical protein
MRANATPGCDARPCTILCKTESTRCSDVMLAARESSGSAVSDVSTKFTSNGVKNTTKLRGRRVFVVRRVALENATVDGQPGRTHTSSVIHS